jgi:N-acetylneuraminate synthase/N,N'-diacetyllegionaminate synthase
MRSVRIGDRLVGEGSPTFVIAEAGVNHNEDLALGKALIKAAKAAGADAIKFQTYTAEGLATRTAPRYWVEPADPEGTQFDTFARLDGLDRDGQRELFAYAREAGIICFSTPFDEASADFLDDLGVPAFKIASADLTAHPLVRHVAGKGKPLILSTGTATLAEIEEALGVIEAAGNREVILLHCTLSYPCPPEAINLRAMVLMRQVFPDHPVGLSDHSLGIAVPQAAVALGAAVIEKHFTVDKTLPGSPDHHLSVDPPELGEMVRGIRTIEAALGAGRKGPVEAERLAHRYARRSVVAAAPIARGTILRREWLTCKRPGTGISPRFFDVVVGRTARVDIPEDSVIGWEMLG